MSQNEQIKALLAKASDEARSKALDLLISGDLQASIAYLKEATKPKKTQRQRKKIERKKQAKARRIQREVANAMASAQTAIQKQLQSIDKMPRRGLQDFVKRLRKSGRIPDDVKANRANVILREIIKDALREGGNKFITEKFKQRTKFVVTITTRTIYSNDKTRKEYQNTRMEPKVYNLGKEEAIARLTDYMDSNWPRETDYKLEYLLDWKYTIEQTGFLVDKYTPRKKIMMKRATVIKHDWLKYAKGIDPSSFTDMRDCCVYEQLSKLCRDPPVNKPQQKVKIENQWFKTTPEGLYDAITCIRNLLNGGNTEQITNFYATIPMDAGVTSEEVYELSKYLKRSMIAYNKHTRSFLSRTQEKSNYCPIVYYCLEEHMYLITDKDSLKSARESERQIRFSSSIIDNAPKKEKQTKESEDPVNYITTFDIDNLNAYASGHYVLTEEPDGERVQSADLLYFVVKYIMNTKRIPLVGGGDSMTSLTLSTDEDKEITLSIDKNISKLIDTECLRRVCETYTIPYKNQGIGYVITNLVERFHLLEHKRQSLPMFDRKAILKKQNGLCALCHSDLEKPEFDHITPLSKGGVNDMENIQALCRDCHYHKTIEERSKNDHKFMDESVSSVSPYVMDIIESNDFSRWQFIETVKDASKIDPRVMDKVDLVKCRRNILLHGQDEWPVYCSLDEPTLYTPEMGLPCGHYYIKSKKKTSRVFPFRGNGWYSKPLIQYGITHRLIDYAEITHILKPSKTLPPDFFVDRCHFLMNAMEDNQSMRKKVVNSMVGCWGQRQQKLMNYTFTTSDIEAGNSLCNDIDNTYVTKLDLQNYFDGHENADMDIYMSTHTQSKFNETTQYPIYAQVLDVEAIRLHTLEQKILSTGGVIYERNTDAILFKKGPTRFPLDEKYRDGSPVYQRESPTSMKFTHSPMNPRLSDEFELKSLDWQMLTIDEVKEECVMDGISCHIDGMAGTGKTYHVNAIIQQLEEQGNTVVRLAPTNKASRLIKGTTLHKWLYRLRTNPYAFQRACLQTDTVVVDEISMMSSEFYQLLLLMKHINEDIQMILVGDFNQLPPVNDTFQGSYMDSWALYHLCDGNRVVLTECKRADKTLFNLCNKVVYDNAIVDVGMFPSAGLTQRNIAFTHRTRQIVNDQCMKVFNSGKVCRYFPRMKDDPKTQPMEICVGTPLVCRKNDLKRGLVNNDYFTVSELKEECVIVDNGEEKVEISNKEFSRLFFVGFCITIHTSQGETIKEKYTIHDWGHPLFTKNLAYVALSRGTSMGNIQIQPYTQSNTKETKWPLYHWANIYDRFI